MATTVACLPKARRKTSLPDGLFVTLQSLQHLRFPRQRDSIAGSSCFLSCTLSLLCFFFFFAELLWPLKCAVDLWYKKLSYYCIGGSTGFQEINKEHLRDGECGGWFFCVVYCCLLFFEVPVARRLSWWRNDCQTEQQSFSRAQAQPFERASCPAVRNLSVRAPSTVTTKLLQLVEIAWKPEILLNFLVDNYKYGRICSYLEEKLGELQIFQWKSDLAEL